MDLYLVFGHEEFAHDHYGNVYRVSNNVDLEENGLFLCEDIYFYGAFSTREKAQEIIRNLETHQSQTSGHFEIAEEKLDTPTDEYNTCLRRFLA